MEIAENACLKIKALVDSAEQELNQATRKKKIRLYGYGLISKIRQTEYALHQIRDLELVLDHISNSTEEKPFKEIEKMSFYCDSYWTFLFSSLEILAQFINQCLEIGLDEEHISFGAIHNTISQRGNHPEIFADLDSIKISYSYSRLRKYRHCSNHRRDICLKKEVNLVEYSDAYTTSTNESQQVDVYICDDALDLNPKYDQKRTIPDFLQSTSEDIFKNFNSILDKLNF